MQCPSIISLIIAFVFLVATSHAQDQPNDKDGAEALAATLKYREGEIVLKNGLATLTVPEGLRFLDGHDAATVLVKLWSNPPMEDPLGMLMPADTSPLDSNAWAVIITYAEDGYVKDQEAEKIDYAELLREMQKGARAANSEREKKGFATVELVGWAAPPRYDKEAHKLYWAKELRFSDAKQNTLNYNIRMLGRRGVLVLNAVAAMSQLEEIEQTSPKILAAIDFNAGHRYADFNPAAGDKIATYGLAALVAGGVAAKLGFFKGLWVLILGAKKFIIIGVLAVGAWFRKLFGKKPATG